MTHPDLWAIIGLCELIGIFYLVRGIHKRTKDHVPFSVSAMRMPRHFHNAPGVLLIAAGAASVGLGLIGALWLLLV